MKSSVFLDWDGVLSDSLSLYLEVFQKACKTYNKVLPVQTAEEFRSWYEPNWEINFAEMGFSQQQYDEVNQSYPHSLNYGDAPLFEGVRDLIRALSPDHCLVVVSTAPTANIVACLKKEGLFDEFQAVTGSDDGSTDKAARLERLRAQFGGAPGVMVGDTHLDIEAGHAAGLTTIGVTYGWLSAQRVQKAAPHYLVSDPRHLQQTIRTAIASLHEPEA